MGERDIGESAARFSFRWIYLISRSGALRPEPGSRAHRTAVRPWTRHTASNAPFSERIRRRRHKQPRRRSDAKVGASAARSSRRLHRTSTCARVPQERCPQSRPRRPRTAPARQHVHPHNSTTSLTHTTASLGDERAIVATAATTRACPQGTGGKSPASPATHRAVLTSREHCQVRRQHGSAGLTLSNPIAALNSAYNGPVGGSPPPAAARAEAPGGARAAISDSRMKRAHPAQLLPGEVRHLLGHHRVRYRGRGEPAHLPARQRVVRQPPSHRRTAPDARGSAAQRNRRAPLSSMLRR